MFELLKPALLNLSMPDKLTIVLGFGCVVSVFALVMTLVNLRVYRRPGNDAKPANEPKVSVCIPARNEEGNIELCARSVLDGDYDNCEVVVYDDDSTDGTGEIVRRLGQADARVKLAPHHALPDGWNGKQHGCWRASQAASGDWLLFTDADVRFSKDALRCALAEAEQLDAPMVSTFPQQRTGTAAEAAVVPMMFFILFSYLPMVLMRTRPDPGLSAGCGQFLLVRRDCYDAFGGHEAFKATMHDGIKMPRAARAAGYKSDLFDGSTLASVRMYEGLGQTWRGFAKNAYEGIGSVGLLCFFTVLHVVGQLGPWVIGGLGLAGVLPLSGLAVALAGVAIAAQLTQRLTLASRLGHTRWSAVLHPLGVVLMTVIQWWSLVLHVTGRRAWRGRVAGPAGSPNTDT